MMRWIKVWTAVLASAALLNACGGGGGSGGTPLGGGTGGGTTPPVVAADLSVTLDALTLANSGTGTVTATVTALDANRNALAAVPVVIVVDSNAIATVSSSTTNETGVLTAAVGIGADRSNRLITVTATSGTISRTASFQVTGSKLTATLVLAVNPGSSNNVQYRLSDVNSSAMPNQAISVSAPGLPSVEGVTDSAGAFTYTYNAPTSPGSLSVTATAAGVSDVQQVQVVAPDGGLPAAVGPVSSASIAANPSVVPVNTATTSNNRTEIRALFVGTGNVPIPNVRVRFDLNGDTNSIGGSVASGSALVYSNASGVVTTAYVPGTRSSPTDGVSVRACWNYTDFAVGTCPNQTVVNLTVTSEPLSVSIGTNGLLLIGDDSLTYIKQYVVQVVNSAGQAMPNVALSPVIDLPSYRKGYFVAGSTGWGKLRNWICPAEDLNRNGVLNAGEDVNMNGSLEPRMADVTIRMLTPTTSASGSAVLQIEYPQNLATWVDYLITVSATGVAGTEGRATFPGTLPALAEHVNNVDASPAFQFSPYGEELDCTDPN